MEELWQKLADFLEVHHVSIAIRVILIVVVGVVLMRIARRALMRFVTPRTTAQSGMLIRRGFSYAIYMLLGFWVLTELGFDPKVLFGAAGILTVAVGFASQTSASNLISGLFLIGERPFVVGDVITINTVTGEIVSIDLMSIKLRTFDNLYVRVPNESVIKSQVTNLTFYPLRRLDLSFEVDPGEDLKALRKLLFTIADQNPVCMDEPRPLVLLKGYGVAGLSVQYSVWAAKENFMELRNTLFEDVKDAFDTHQIKIAYSVNRILVEPSAAATVDAENEEDPA